MGECVLGAICRTTQVEKRWGGIGSPQPFPEDDTRDNNLGKGWGAVRTLQQISLVLGLTSFYGISFAREALSQSRSAYLIVVPLLYAA